MEVLNSQRVRYAEIAARLLVDRLTGKPKKPVTITVGWPSRGSTRGKRLTLGECVMHVVDTSGAKAQKEDHGHFITLHPKLYRDHLEVLHVLAHELIHAIYPKAGHRGEFIGKAKAIGLNPPWTSTTPSPELIKKFQAWHPDILKTLGGEFPKGGAELAMWGKKQGIRQVKGECECGRIIRASRQVWDQGDIRCSLCDKEFLIVVSGE